MPLILLNLALIFVQYFRSSALIPDAKIGVNISNILTLPEFKKLYNGVASHQLKYWLDSLFCGISSLAHISTDIKCIVFITSLIKSGSRGVYQDAYAGCHNSISPWLKQKQFQILL